jgi:ferredoxin
MMKISNVSLAYFSAAYTTRKVVRILSEQFSGNITEYDITQTSPATDIIIRNDNLLIVGVPVYYGRVPALAAEALKKFKGNNTPAVIVCVYGNRPYKTPGSVLFKPEGNRKCNECGTCVKLCPMQAIPGNTPRKTIKEKCISCGRCITVCPQYSRHFGGLLYKLISKKFVKANAARKEPTVVYL